ncbi:hypothetical protein BH23BAC1_BH23BAC1_24890 [soil metagenome]
MNIVHTGLHENTLNLLKNSLVKDDQHFIQLKENEINNSFQLIDDSDVVLLGEATDNPIKIAQRIHAHTPYVSIILINDPASYQKIKQSLLFTPFLGPTIFSVSNAAGKGLVEIVKDHSLRTQQRKSYIKVKSSLLYNPAVTAPNKDNITTEYLNKVLEEAPVGIALINKEGNILSFNQYASTLFLKSERDALGTLFVQLFPEDLASELNSFLQESDRKEIFYFHNGSSEKFLEIILFSLKSESHAYKIVLISDVTDKVLARKAIEETAQKVKIILDSLPDMAWTALPDGDVDYYSYKWYSYTGQKPEEALGKGWGNVIHPDDLKMIQKLWKISLKKNIPYEVECRYWNFKNQAYYWHLTRATPVKDEGELIQWVGTSTEIQKLKDTEDELHKTTLILAKKNKELFVANEEIQANNEELSAANEEIRSTNDELFQTNQQLIKVNADLDNFIYTASHDFKAPITNIEGLAKLLKIELEQKKYLNKDIEEIVNMIHSSINRFQRTISDLTEISKIQRNINLDYESVDLREIINDVLMDFQPQIKSSDAQLQVNLNKQPFIHFSRKNLKSIVYNLISNAIKYRSFERIPNVVITTHEEDNFFVFSVQDNGLGLNVKDEKKIFSMFQRLHTHVEGTGIGLYMVKKILDNAGGKITLESEVGKGSTFRVYFPLNNKEI